MGRLPQRVRLAKASRGTGKWFVRKGDSCDYEGSELRALFLGMIVGLDGIVSGALLDTDDAQETDEFDDVDTSTATDLIRMIQLKWNSNAKTKVYPVGECPRTLQRRKVNLKAREMSVADQPRLAHFGFVRVAVPVVAPAEIPAPGDGPNFNVNIGEEAGNEDVDDNVPVVAETEENMVAAITEIEKTVKCIDNKKHEKKQLEVTKYKYNQLLSVLAYFNLRIGEAPKLKMDASSAVALIMFPKSSRSIFSYKSRCIRLWAAQYLLTGDIAKSKQGCHPKTHSIIFDEGAKATMKDHLRNQSALLRTPQSFMNDLNATVLRTIPNAPNTVGLQTARRWLFHLGFAPVRHGKGYYVDGHEREDVVEYRTAYLARMLEVERKVGYWEGDEMQTFVEPELQPGEKKLVFITHDESIFYSNESMIVTWEMDGFRSLRPKSKGRSLHVSGFCCPCHGFISDALCDSFEIIKPGKNADGYWTNADLVNQLESVMPLFERMHPGCDLIFSFDNSQNHHAKCANGLDATKLNKSDGGKNVVHQRDSVWNGQPYKMQHMVSGVLKQKGLKTILQERGDWDHDMAKEAAVARLALHIDFQQQREWLAETVENAGHKIDYYPKFHCELNFIEMVWGYCKTKLRRRCTYNFKDMQTELPHTLRTVPIPFFRRVYRHCMRYMSGYRRGLEGPLLDYALKKYKSHRAIPVFVLAELEVELQADKEKKKVKRELA